MQSVSGNATESRNGSFAHCLRNFLLLKKVALIFCIHFSGKRERKESQKNPFSQQHQHSSQILGEERGKWIICYLIIWFLVVILMFSGAV